MSALRVPNRLPWGVAALPPPINDPEHGPITVDDWYAMPEDGPRYELYEGALVMVPPPNLGHQEASMPLSAAMYRAAAVAGGHVLTAPTGVSLSDSVAFEPDILYLSPERMHLRSERGIEGAPDIVVEVSSRSTRRYDLTVKLPSYLAHGVREVWIIDPVAKTVAVHAADGTTIAVAFGEHIPSAILDVGNADLDRLPPPPRKSPRVRK